MILPIASFAVSLVAFCLVLGDFSWQNLLVGSGIVAPLMYIFRHQIIPSPLPPMRQAFHVLIYAPVLVYFLIIDILRGTWQVTMITLGLHKLRRPGIVRVSFEGYTPYAVGPIGFFVTLSPGSFLVDVEWEERVMLIHVLDASDPEVIRRDAARYLRLWEYVPPRPYIGQPDLATPPEDDDE
jgi:multisubunit Na+/H+ antiporter MnhE subunit